MANHYPHQLLSMMENEMHHQALDRPSDQPQEREAHGVGELIILFLLTHNFFLLIQTNACRSGLPLPLRVSFYQVRKIPAVRRGHGKISGYELFEVLHLKDWNRVGLLPK